jgi:ComF family protein
LCDQLGHPSPCAACREELVAHAYGERRPAGELAYRVAIYPYRGRAGQAVRRLKYARCTSLAPFLAEEIARAVETFGLDPELVVPVPIHWSRRCARGFNQAELLCERLDATPSALVRVRRTRPQVGLTEEERLRNLQGAFRADPRVAGKRVLLVDDVLTSGQTARECARALRAAGATEVGFLAFCGEAGAADVPQGQGDAQDDDR